MDNPGRLNFLVTVMTQRDDLLRRKFAPVDRVCHAIYQFLTKYNRILQRQNELAQEVSGLYFRSCFYLKCITRSMLNMCRCGEGGSHISLTLYFSQVFKFLYYSIEYLDAINDEISICDRHLVPNFWQWRASRYYAYSVQT